MTCAMQNAPLEQLMQEADQFDSVYLNEVSNARYHVSLMSSSSKRRWCSSYSSNNSSIVGEEMRGGSVKIGNGGRGR